MNISKSYSAVIKGLSVGNDIGNFYCIQFIINCILLFFLYKQDNTFCRDFMYIIQANKRIKKRNTVNNST